MRDCSAMPNARRSSASSTAPRSPQPRWPSRSPRTGWNGGAPTRASSATAAAASSSRSAGSAPTSIPVGASPAAIAAFAELAAHQRAAVLVDRRPGRCGARPVVPAGDPRGVRPARSAPASRCWRRIRRPRCRPIPAVRLVRPDELDLLFPASVAMYTEEVGVSPLDDRGGARYRQRVADLVDAAARTPGSSTAGRLQGRTRRRHPAHRAGAGRLGAPGLPRPGARRGRAWPRSSATRCAGSRPTVSLYVNDYNAPARHVYARCGFAQVDTFATVLF